MPLPEELPYSDIFVGGDLLKRMERNFDRLESTPYQHPGIFKPSDHDWPGDYEGRVILGLVLLAQASHREPLYLSEIMDNLSEHVNVMGYFGPVRRDGTVDEQQLAGNSWVLRAMVEYYRWKHDGLSYRIIQNTVENLLWPVNGFYSAYPSDRRLQTEGGPAGQLLGHPAGRWLLSTDVGCAFILLDGATAAYQIVPDPKLKRLIEEMVQRFAKIEPQALSMQTHATLSAARGILRHYEISGDPSSLSLAERTYRIYTEHALTPNYANYNWFGRPQWTEACAIIDSFMLAVQLWKHTQCAHYLDDAHKIYFNAISYAQRPNGGFGCDFCVGPTRYSLEPLRTAFEASWCCTMRGGEGLARATQYTWFMEKNHITLPFYHNGIARIALSTGQITIRQTTRYPIDGAIRLEVLQSSIVEETTVNLYIPEWVEDNRVSLTLNGAQQSIVMINRFIAITKRFQPGDIVQLIFPIPLLKVTSITHPQRAWSLWHGSLLLGVNAPPGDVLISSSETFIPLENAFYRTQESRALLGPITDLYLTNTESAVVDRRQVWFPMIMSDR